MTQQNGWLEQNRKRQVKSWMQEIIEEGLLTRFLEHPGVAEKKSQLEEDVLEGRTTSFRAARLLLGLYQSSEQ